MNVDLACMRRGRAGPRSLLENASLMGEEAGEFILDLHLRRVVGEWVVFKTDEMTSSELHEARGTR